MCNNFVWKLDIIRTLKLIFDHEPLLTGCRDDIITWHLCQKNQKINDIFNFSWSFQKCFFSPYHPLSHCAAKYSSNLLILEYSEVTKFIHVNLREQQNALKKHYGAFSLKNIDTADILRSHFIWKINAICWICLNGYILNVSNSRFPLSLFESLF